MDSERTLRRPPMFHFFSPRPVVVKLRMRSPLPGTQMFHSDGTIIINQNFLVLISFHSHSFFSSPSTSFPRSPLHEYTLNASRPSQLYFRQCCLVTGIYPITPRRCLYCWLLSSLPPSNCEHPWSHCISFLLIHFEICCLIG